MLDGLRRGAKSLPAKMLLILLVIAFAVWGVAGSFSGYGAGTIAHVGDTEVSSVEFDRALQQRLQAIQNQTGQPFTMEQARAVGLPQQVLGELVANAALSEQARELNLGMSEEELAEAIAADPAFRGPTGQFDRVRFQSLLRNAGMDEDDYIQDVRRNVVRRQIAQALIGAADAPEPMVRAFYQMQNEERAISFVTVGSDAVPPVERPDEATLQAYYEDRAGDFMAPEYRSLGLIAIDAASLAEPDSITEEAIRGEYERRLDQYGQPEQRRILQVRFDSEEQAQAAADALDAGGTFDDLVAERGLTTADVDLGMKTRPQIIDQAIADAAFAADEGAVIPVLDADLGPAIIRVAEVRPGSVTPLAEVESRIRQDLALRAAGDRIYDLHNEIEDERAAGATLQEVAETLALDYRTVEAVAADGTTPAGEPVDFPAADEIVPDAFASDVGVENDPIRIGSDGFVFYEVLGTTPERERELEEVRDDVVETWQREVVADRVAERAQELFDRLQGGATLETVAGEIGAAVETRDGVMRGSQPEGLSANAVAQAFAGPEGHVGNADGMEPAERILLHVDDVTVPAFFDEAAGNIRQMVSQTVQNDLLQTYNADLLQGLPPRINNQIYAQLTGAATPN